MVRHGQASFGAHNYDELSPTGHRQSERLGAHWRALGFSADAWYSGSMARQKSTGTSVLAAMGVNGAAVAEHAGFDEYDHAGLITAYLPVIAAEHPEFKVQRRDLFSDPRTFQRFFEKVTACWVQGRDGAQPVKETWAAFSARCAEGLRAAAPEGTGSVAVFTSGGVIAAALAEALKLDGATAFEMNWRIYNASVHVFRLGRRGLTLLGFNNVSHLELAKDASLLTFR
ncbi:MAG: histidine phosphatase family protein [Nevskiaceae bacterium]